jgi:hypothetical protein
LSILWLAAANFRVAAFEATALSERACCLPVENRPPLQVVFLSCSARSLIFVRC